MKWQLRVRKDVSIGSVERVNNKGGSVDSLERWSHLTRSIHTLSTEDLAMAAAILQSACKKAIKHEDVSYYVDMRARLRACELELHARQMVLDGLEPVRDSQDRGSAD